MIPNKGQKIRIIRAEELSTPELVQNPDRKNDWIQYGVDNNFGKYLLSLLDKSSIHASIQFNKINLAVGKGIRHENPFQSTEIAIAFQKFIENPNNDETLEELSYKLFHDLVIFGAYSLEVIWSKDRKSIAEIHHLPYEKVRTGKPEDGKITHYYYSDDWTQIKKAEFTPQYIAAYDVNNRKDPRQLMVVKEYNASSPYYGKPQYYPTMKYCEIDGLVADYHLNSMEGGLSADYIIQLNNAEGMSPEEQDELYYSIKQELSGTKGNKWMLTFGSGQDQQPTLVEIPTNDNDQKFLTLQEACMQNILTGNKLTNPGLAGIKTPQGLGSKDELIDAFNLYYESVISKLVKMLSSTYNQILRINEIPVTVTFEKAQPLPFSVSEQTLLAIADKNEIRAMLGMEPIKETTQIN
jgi:hypothetical protein